VPPEPREPRNKSFEAQVAKTKMCRFFALGQCRFSAHDCRFAHSVSEMKVCPDLSKTSLCRAWCRGECPLSSEECSFAHGCNELRRTTAPQSKARHARASTSSSRRLQQLQEEVPEHGRSRKTTEKNQVERKLSQSEESTCSTTDLASVRDPAEEIDDTAEMWSLLSSASTAEEADCLSQAASEGLADGDVALEDLLLILESAEKPMRVTSTLLQLDLPPGLPAPAPVVTLASSEPVKIPVPLHRPDLGSASDK